MKESIRQLTVQAGLVRVGDFGMKRWEGAHSDSITDQDLEKFALLIVQECIDMISPYTVSMNRPGEEYLHPILEIKKHFGVEL
jgi:hypothetical protein